MNSWLNFDVHKQHSQELQREAEQHRLAREAQANQSVNPVVGAAMVALGRQFVKLGEHLQEQYAEPGVVQLAPVE